MTERTNLPQEAAHTAAETAGQAAEGAHQSAPGMPQLDFATFPHQIFWIFLALTGIYLILRFIAIPRIEETLDNRAQTIQRDLDRAADGKLQAETAERHYHESLAQARSDAQTIAEEMRAKIQKDLNEAIAASDAELAQFSRESVTRISAIREEAPASIEEIANDVAIAVIEEMASKAPDSALVSRTVSTLLKEG